MNINFILLLVVLFMVYKYKNEIKDINFKLLLGVIFFLCFIYPIIIRQYKKDTEEFKNTLKI
tara:strand:- start:265 stop:450 length:186 start_codon:yes stop_codon:yes gene_type:complete